MILLWSYMWPIIAVGVAIGALTGWFAFRPLRIRRSGNPAEETRPGREWQRTQRIIFAAGAAASLAFGLLWYGPFGAADHLASDIEAAARAELDRQEMSGVTARLERGPLRRRLVLSGPADDFQRRELIRMMGDIPGVSSVRWPSPPVPTNELRSTEGVT